MFDYKRKQAFAEYAAQQLGVGIDQLDGGAANDDIARSMEDTIGDAYAFAMFVRGQHLKSVRGWVTGDNTVITLTQNLGRLFEEAGAWDEAPRVEASQLAERFIWAFGHQTETHNHMLAWDAERSPGLDVENGAGTFSFTMAVRQSGPGGAGGGPTENVEVVVALSPDHTATLEQR